MGDKRADEPPQIGAVLLAAGESTRFGEGNKLLAEVGSSAVVRQAAETLCESAVDSTVVVLGHEADRVRHRIDDLDIETRVNEAYTEGQSTSVATGVDIARDNDWDSVVFALGDMPFVDPATIDTLRDAYVAGKGTVIVPEYQNSRGNPVLFDRRHYGALATVSGDTGGRQLVRSIGTLVSVDDAGVRRDIDHPSDLP